MVAIWNVRPLAISTSSRRCKPRHGSNSIYIFVLARHRVSSHVPLALILVLALLLCTFCTETDTESDPGLTTNEMYPRGTRRDRPDGKIQFLGLWNQTCLVQKQIKRFHQTHTKQRNKHFFDLFFFFFFLRQCVHLVFRDT